MRVIELFIAIIMLVVFIPLIIIISIWIRLKFKSSIFFTQLRPGLNGKIFKIYKFRTMFDGTDNEGATLPDSERLTSFGMKLRSTSLDELPGLWNVLKGDMSLVGPRPLLVEYLPLYNPEQARRHNVRPGITGWAQVNGRNAISWEQKFEYDVWYVENQSFWLDIKILFLTVKKVFLKDGISAEGEVTMSKFTGND
ncbi:sugar transferase [Aliivibrio salmonicida]|uniref:sugar transferase n=1 Tax=Aliivibrio salmonicida TaxID=40269 RepID=UPI00406C6210